LLVELLTPLMEALTRTDDILACLAALQQVTELATLHTVPSAISEQALSHLRPLIAKQQDFTLLSAALQCSAHMLPAVSTSAVQGFYNIIESFFVVRNWH
jgi:hypothetical protein